MSHQYLMYFLYRWYIIKVEHWFALPSLSMEDRHEWFCRATQTCGKGNIQIFEQVSTQLNTCSVSQ